MSLFDSIERNIPSDHSEHKSQFDFLNRSPSHGRVRDTLETWFRDFPSDAQPELRSRFRNKELTNHEGALFELFLHELLRQLGCSLELYPTIDDARLTPDFRVFHQESCFYVEATSVGQTMGPFTRNKNEEDVINKLKQLKSPRFNIEINMEGKLKETLSKSEVCSPFEQLLSSNEPDEVQKLIDRGGRSAAPSRTISRKNWCLTGRLVPINEQEEHACENRQIRIDYAEGKFTDVVSPLRQALRKKSKRYQSLDESLVLAINARDRFYNGKNNALDLLFGDEVIVSEGNKFCLGRKENGFWYHDNCRHIDAVAIFKNINAFNFPYASVCVYFNPRKPNMVIPDVLLQLPHAMVCGDKIKWVAGKKVADILGARGSRLAKTFSARDIDNKR